MKLIKRHIQKFEQFIQNPKYPKDEVKRKCKKEPEPEIQEDDEEIQENPENDEKDIIDELNEYFKNQKLPKTKWTSIT